MRRYTLTLDGAGAGTSLCHMSAPASRYEDRFQTSKYAEDEPVGVFVHADDPDAMWVPERLFSRLVLTARAYELHILPLLGGPERVRLNATQVTQNLLDEIAFVVHMLRDDPLVAEQGARLDQYLREVFASNPLAVVTVEGS